MFWQDMRNEVCLLDGTWRNGDVAGIWDKGSEKCYSVGIGHGTKN